MIEAPLRSGIIDKEILFILFMIKLKQFITSKVNW